MAEHRALSGPPLLLAIESATARAGVALLRGADVLGTRESAAGQHHSETLLPMIDALLGDVGLGLENVEAFAVSIGPGAFTSLRIGLATVKGLAFATDRPVAAVPTLEALALAAVRSGAVSRGALAVPALDARRGEVYAAAHRVAGDGSVEEIVEPGVHTAEALADRLPDGAVLVGEGAPLLAPDLEALRPGLFDAKTAAAVLPEAVSVALLGQRLLAAGQGADAAALVPRYVRRAEAEALRTEQPYE